MLFGAMTHRTYVIRPCSSKNRFSREFVIPLACSSGLGRHLLLFIPCFPVGYREISVKIFFDLTLVPQIARASQPDGNMTSFTLHFSRLT